MMSTAYENLTKTWQASCKPLKTLETEPDAIEHGFARLKTLRLWSWRLTVTRIRQPQVMFSCPPEPTLGLLKKLVSISRYPAWYSAWYQTESSRHLPTHSHFAHLPERFKAFAHIANTRVIIDVKKFSELQVTLIDQNSGLALRRQKQNCSLSLRTSIELYN